MKAILQHGAGSLLHHTLASRTWSGCALSGTNESGFKRFAQIQPGTGVRFRHATLTGRSAEPIHQIKPARLNDESGLYKQPIGA